MMSCFVVMPARAGSKKKAKNQQKNKLKSESDSDGAQAKRMSAVQQMERI